MRGRVTHVLQDEAKHILPLCRLIVSEPGPELKRQLQALREWTTAADPELGRMGTYVNNGSRTLIHKLIESTHVGEVAKRLNANIATGQSPVNVITLGNALRDHFLPVISTFHVQTTGLVSDSFVVARTFIYQLNSFSDGMS